MTSHKLLCTVLLVLALTSSSCEPLVRSTLPRLEVDSFILDNGLQVVLEPDSASPMVAVAIDYRVGAADQPNGAAGFAHLFEHLLLQGTLHVSHELQETIFEESGGMDNARTDYDYTELVSVGPSTDLETILWIQSDRMGFLFPNATEASSLELQKKVVANERHQRIDSTPLSLALEALVGSLFPAQHPYHDLVIGPVPQLAQVDLDAARKFYAAYYGPSNAILVITGDFERAEARRLVDRYFGGLRRKTALRPRASLPVLPKRTGKLTITRNDDVASATLLIGWVTPPAFSADELGVRAALTILSDGESSLLKRKLVTELAMATSADCSYSPLRLASMAICLVNIKEGVDPRTVEREVFRLLDDLKRQGPSLAELQRCVTVWKAALMKELEGIRGRSLRLAWYALLTGDPLYFRKDLARMSAIGPKEVQAGVSNYLAKDDSVVVLLSPRVAK